MKNFDLNDWDICNPDNRQDILPQPYRLINEVLNETILHKLSLSMYEIEQKKKDKNYEGSVKEYVSQNTIEVDNISCFSSESKHHNHLLAGDKGGNIYLLDLAKKIVFSKKELVPSRRVLSISQTIISDGDISLTTAAVTLNSHGRIYILRYKHSEPKLVLTHQIEVALDENDPNKLPYSCEFDDYGRLLFVYTYEGSILLYKLPEVSLDLDEINRNQTIALQEEQFKKRLRYPLNYAVFESQVAKIRDRWCEITFEGKRIPLTRQQLIAKMTNKIEQPVAEVEPVKKDPKKKEDKKIEQEPPAPKQQLQFNTPLKKHDLIIENGYDVTPNYQPPKFKPFVYVIHSRVQLPKKKQFQTGKFIQISQKLIFGWQNLKQFKYCNFLSKKTNYLCNFQYIQHYLQKIPQKFSQQKSQYLNQKLAIKNEKTLKTIYEITATALSKPDQQYFATGMANGVISVWSTNTLNIKMNTDKQLGQITCLKFFEGWKLISGSSKGEVFIDNILQIKNEVKRTNTFQSKIDYRICNIKISELGLAFVLDSNANLRVYDLWRNQKIAKLLSCNNFSIAQSKANRWIPSYSISPSIGIYTNNDFTVILSNNWPNYSSRDLEQSQQKRKQIQALISNPWKYKGTNVHVVRNFQFLLTLFEGLENIYKKGYERKKIQNLFSNLQFTQLYDRNFDIPDFGVTNPAGRKSGQKKSEVGFSSSKSRISAKSKGKSQLNESSNGSQSQTSKLRPKLTDEVLHPEKFLLQRRKVEKQEVITDERLKNTIRDIYKKQNALDSNLQTNLSKGVL